MRSAVFIDHPAFSVSAWHGLHPLAFSRQKAVRDVAQMMGWLAPADLILADMPDAEALARFHDPAYIAALRDATERGKVTIAERETWGFGTMENPIFLGLYERAIATVGGSIAAAKAALAGHIAFHPAGGTHHGQAARASGFCYFNDPAFAIQTLLDGGLERVFYFDIDAHHGDGVEALFAGDPRVALFSVHEEGRFPYTGLPNSVSPANSINVAVPRELNDSELAWIMDHALHPVLERFAPQGIVVTAGADCLFGDPLSAMALSNSAFWAAIADVIERIPHSVVLGGGGYNPWTLTRAWAGLWATLAGFEVGAPLTRAVAALLVSFESDLVDGEDVEVEWLTQMVDSPREGVVRDTVKARCDAALARFMYPHA